MRREGEPRRRCGESVFLEASSHTPYALKFVQCRSQTRTGRLVERGAIHHAVNACFDPPDRGGTRLKLGVLHGTCKSPSCRVLGEGLSALSYGENRPFASEIPYG